MIYVILGFCYEFGVGVEKNEDDTFKYYKISSDLGNSYG